jgi:tRNA threonylcarbamoyladenosine biosynthesis protein TsaE
MDVYRLEDEDEDLGFYEYFYGDGVCVIEWPSRIASYLPDERLDITLSRLFDDKREISFKPFGKRYETLCKELFA